MKITFLLFAAAHDQNRNEYDKQEGLGMARHLFSELCLNIGLLLRQATGTINDYTIDVNAIGFVVIGHLLHHLKIIRERYLMA